MEDSYTLTEHPEDFRGMPDVALQHTCMQVTHPGSTGPDPPDLWPVWAQVSAPLYTFTYSATVHLWYPAHPHSLQEVMTCQEKGHECLKLFITGQLRILHFLTWCLIAELCHAARLNGRCGAAPSNVARRSLTGCSASRSIAWIHFLSWERARRDTPELTHGLALTNFLDCNTRHVECSTRCVPSLGTHNSNCSNNNETHRGTESKWWRRYKLNKRNKNQGKYLFIYLNSLVLNRCLYTVNSAVLQRITFKQTLRNFERC